MARKGHGRSCVLTGDQVLEICQRIKKGETQRSLAKEFGVTPQAINWHHKQRACSAGRML